MTSPSTIDDERTRTAQVGFIMKAYRESFLTDDGRRGISQDDLLRRMADVDPQSSRITSHATVSRWESGGGFLTTDRLRTFGKALNLSDTEINGLITLAGLDPERQELRTLTCPRCGGDTQATNTHVIRKTTKCKTVTSTAVRTRGCLACGHTAESSERWIDDPEETTGRKAQSILDLLESTSEQLRQALAEARMLQLPQATEDHGE